ncbi:MAG: hypothetical protein RLZZ338_2262 [Cyanobacteriota bacterium]|jgi:hypothetical protein
MAQNENSGQGCQGCLTCVFSLLGFVNPIFWVVAGILWWFTAKDSPPSTTTTPSPAPSSPVPDELNNILMDLSNGEIKDPVTQEIFRPGERVHLCHVHRLAYHEDSWTHIGCKCMNCGNHAQTKVYILPHPVNVNVEIAERLGIKFRDIE